MKKRLSLLLLIMTVFASVTWMVSNTTGHAFVSLPCELTGTWNLTFVSVPPPYMPDRAITTKSVQLFVQKTNQGFAATDNEMHTYEFNTYTADRDGSMTYLGTYHQINCPPPGYQCGGKIRLHTDVQCRITGTLWDYLGYITYTFSGNR
ncbi:MAG: hypothetical protein HQK53_17780 [Oligoflexia bacterium]|nr:hypothetical protein [Oligoflexia bacterium]